MLNQDTEEQIFDFEGNFESAVRDLLDSRGILAYITGTDELLGENFVGAVLTIQEALEHFDRKPSGKREFSRYRAMLEIRITTQRDTDFPEQAIAEDVSKTQGLHRSWRAMIRKEMQLDDKRPFDSENLPMYTVRWIRPMSSSFEGTSDNGLDVSRINYEIIFDINSSAWPG